MKAKKTQFSPQFIEAVRAQNRSAALLKAIKAKDDDVGAVIAAVKEGADLNRMIEEKFPLQWAIHYGKFERFKTLAAIEPINGEKANLDTPVLVGESKVEMSYLHYAALRGDSKITGYLFRHRGMSGTVYDKHPQGLLPIHCAAAVGDIPTLEALNTDNQALKAVTGAGSFCIHIAAEQGKLKMVQYLLELGADVNSRDNQDRLPVHCAAKRGHRDIVELLLKQKRTSRNYWDKRGRNTYLYAVQSGDSELVKSLIVRGDKYSYCDSNGTTAMHIAAECKQINIMRFLHGKDGLSFTVRDKVGRMPIHIAAEKDLEDVFDFILGELGKELRASLVTAQKANELEMRVADELKRVLLTWQDENGDTVIEYSVRGGANKIIERLRALGLNFNRTNKKGETLLHEAAAQGDLAKVALLLQLGLSATQRTSEIKSPVRLAVENGRINVLEEFRKIPHFDFRQQDEEGMLLIHWAAGAGQQQAVEWLAKNSGGQLTEVDRHGRNCLFHAVRGDHDELVVYLLTILKMSLSTLCAKKLSLMHHAVFKSAKKSIHALRKLGLSLEVQDDHGMNPFHLACRSGLPLMVDFLVELGVDKQATNKTKRNGWFYAVAQCPGEEILKCLYKHGVNLFSALDINHVSPVHIAAMSGNLVAVKFFHDKGQNCFAEDRRGETPMKKARDSCEKAEKELMAKTEKKDSVQSVFEMESAECIELRKKIQACKEVVSFLLELKQTEKITAEKETAEDKVKEKRERELQSQFSEPPPPLRIVKPKVARFSAQEVTSAVPTNDDEPDGADQLASSGEGDAVKRPKF